jgi:polyhydroxyalkanoate synthesis repressor PhaR
VDFVVVDKKNNADITRSILLQVIAEQEHLPDPILSQDFMIDLIRSYGGPAQSQVGGQLEQTLRQFMSQQPAVRERVKSYPAARSPEEGYKALSGREAQNLPK